MRDAALELAWLPGIEANLLPGPAHSVTGDACGGPAVGDPRLVSLIPSLVDDLNVALDEATVQGVRWDHHAGRVRVLLQVLTMPAHGPPGPDPRRVLTLEGVSDLRVLLRRDSSGAISYGPPVRLANQQALQDFFASLTFDDSMHGGKALDDPSPVDDWPATTSLNVRFRAGRAAHCLYWFTECGRGEPGGMIGYLLEGLVRFDTLAVQRADHSPVTTCEFADDARRWWIARHNGDPRVSAHAQRALSGPSWHR